MLHPILLRLKIFQSLPLPSHSWGLVGPTCSRMFLSLFASPALLCADPLHLFHFVLEDFASLEYVMLFPLPRSLLSQCSPRTPASHLTDSWSFSGRSQLDRQTDSLKTLSKLHTPTPCPSEKGNVLFFSSIGYILFMGHVFVGLFAQCLSFARFLMSRTGK